MLLWFPLIFPHPFRFVLENKQNTTAYSKISV